MRPSRSLPAEVMISREPMRSGLRPSSPAILRMYRSPRTSAAGTRTEGSGRSGGKRMDFQFRPYEAADRERCLALFDANCPAYFAANERGDYCAFLDSLPGDYAVVACGATIHGAFGLETTASNARLNWIMIDPACHGRGIGSAIMAEIIARARKLGR